MRNRIVVYPIAQTLLGLPRLRPISDIPNQAGFKLVLVKRGANGDSHIPVTVKKDFNGLHYCVDNTGKYRLCTVFDGWLTAQEATV